MPSNHFILSCPLLPPSVFPIIITLSSASGYFQMSELFPSGGQSIRVSASASVLPMNTQAWSPLEWTSWISLQSKGLSRVFSSTTVQKHQFFSAQFSHSPTLTILTSKTYKGIPNSKESACNSRDLGSIPGLEYPLEKGMATHSSILAWRIPWTEEPRIWACKEWTQLSN